MHALLKQQAQARRESEYSTVFTPECKGITCVTLSYIYSDTGTLVSRSVTHHRICFAAGGVLAERWLNRNPGSPPEIEAVRRDPTGTDRE